MKSFRKKFGVLIFGAMGLVGVLFLQGCVVTPGTVAYTGPYYCYGRGCYHNWNHWYHHHHHHYCGRYGGCW